MTKIIKKLMMTAQMWHHDTFENGCNLKILYADSISRFSRFYHVINVYQEMEQFFKNLIENGQMFILS